MPLANLDNRQGPEDPQASKEASLFFKGLTQQAALAGVAVDVLAVGQAAVNVLLLGFLSQRTGGKIMAHQRKLSASACFKTRWALIQARSCIQVGVGLESGDRCIYSTCSRSTLML